MKDHEFKQKLSEVAEWKIPVSIQETSLNAKKRRGRKSNEEIYQEAREEMFHEEFGGVNTTAAPMLIKLKIQSCVCEDCGKFCENGRRKEIKQYETNRTHWREKCVTCDRTKNPYTGEFDLSPQGAAAKWAEWLRKTNGKEVQPYCHVKKPLDITLPHSERDHELEDTESGVIRKFTD